MVVMAAKAKAVVVVEVRPSATRLVESTDAM